MNRMKYWNLLAMSVAVLAVAGLVALAFLLSSPFPQAALAQGPCVAGPHSGTISSDQSWCLADSPHIVNGDVIVSEGVTLTVEPGVTVKFSCPFSIFPCDRGLIVHGTLDAQGTSTDTIRFTSNSVTPAKDDWGQIHFGDYSTGSILDYVIVEYGGNPYTRVPLIYATTDSLLIDHSTIRRSGDTGVKLNNASPTIRNTTFADNDGSALYLDGGSCFPTLSGLSATGNNYDAISINGSTYTTDYTWGDAGIPTYRVLNDITVNQGVTLTIEPGTTIKFEPGYDDPRVIVQGTLLARGTYTDTILFTSDSATPSKGDWRHIYFEQTSVGSVLEYVTVEYGGGNLHSYESVLVDTSSLTIHHSTILRSSGDGIRLNGGAPTIEYNSIVENNGYGVNNRDSSVTAYARCNWWGHASGPTHASNPGGQGQAVSDDVVFFYWLTSEGGECSFYQVFSPLVVR